CSSARTGSCGRSPPARCSSRCSIAGCPAAGSSGPRQGRAHNTRRTIMRSRVSASLLALLAVCALPEAARAFCGFYVASGDAKLFNHRSQVALVHDGDRTVMTMASDYEGDPKEFALVVPVPVVLKRGQIHVGDSTLVAKLDAYSAPRLVEYFDPDPCPVAEFKMRGGRPNAAQYLTA